jgi:hypothetical protein
MEQGKKLHARTKEWWEHLYISYDHNKTSPAWNTKQYGGIALFSIGSAAHRVTEKSMGRWAWTRCRGKNNHILRIITAYRPNLPNGPFTVYAQHNAYLNSTNDIRWPRLAFKQNVSSSIEAFLESGDRIILLIDGNSNMISSNLQLFLSSLHLHEVILEKHGTNGPETHRKNTTRTPNDRTWASVGIQVALCSYLVYNKLLPNSDHRCI